MKKINSKVAISKEVTFELDTADIIEAIKVYTKVHKVSNAKVDLNLKDGTAVVTAVIVKNSEPATEVEA